jgi:hypothetical protein
MRTSLPIAIADPLNRATRMGQTISGSAWSTGAVFAKTSLQRVSIIGGHLLLVTGRLHRIIGAVSGFSADGTAAIAKRSGDARGRVGRMNGLLSMMARVRLIPVDMIVPSFLSPKQNRKWI